MRKSQTSDSRLIACAGYAQPSIICAVLATLLLLAVAPARADWPNTNATKWVQYPITTASGTNALDIDVLDSEVTDDFPCYSAGPVTDIHVWGAWLNDQIDTNATFIVWIATNAFAPSDLWSQVFGPGQYTARKVYTNTEAFWNMGQVIGSSQYLWQYNFYPTNPFVQQGSPSAPVTYWLGIAQWYTGSNSKFGWKCSSNHWGSGAVGAWNLLPLPGIDMSFALTTRSCSSATPPTAQITSPSSTNVCSMVNVVGSASDPGGLPVGYTLQYQYLPWNSAPGPLMTFASGSGPVVNGLLGVWDNSTLPAGSYHLHLVVTNNCNLSTTADAYVYVCGTGMSDHSVSWPVAGSVVGGSVCIKGFVWDTCFSYYVVEYRPAGVGNFQPVDAAHPTYTSVVYNDVLAWWKTTDATGVPLVADGKYDIRVTTCNCCGNCVTNPVFTVIVDNTPPIATITSPQSCTRVSGLVPVVGAVADNNWGTWLLQYSDPDTHSWVTIISASASQSGVLGVWDTTRLPACSYVLRLWAQDSAVLQCDPDLHHTTEYLVPVTTQDCPIPPSVGASMISNAAVVSVTGQTNVSYTVEYTPVLPPTGSWTILSNFVLTQSPERVLDYSISNIPQRFYRARTP
ncbi:MAG TPA: hypothetical protein VMU04_03155 [Candidatus Acidoferrum sp.]|nr:hypothetical protein [Candidatus Acidoferrum sp.]